MSRIPTIDPRQATGRSKELLQGLQKKLGMTPNLMRAMANSPAALDAYLQFGQTLGEGVLSAKTREQIALAVAEDNSCAYCLSAHSAVGKMVGLDADEIHAARGGRSADAKTNAILQLTKSLVENRGQLTDDELASTRNAGVNDAEIAEVIANTAYSIYSNYFNHVAETEVDFPKVEALEVPAVGDPCLTETCST